MNEDVECFAIYYEQYGSFGKNGYESNNLEFYNEPSPVLQATLFEDYESANACMGCDGRVVKVKISVMPIDDDERRQIDIKAAEERVAWAQETLEKNLQALEELRKVT